jgi:hypothetical protein
MVFKTDAERKAATRIPKNIKATEVLERLLLNLTIEFPDKFTPDKISNIIGKR